MAESQLSWIGRIIAGRYKIEAQLGQGGMSTVYRATDPNLRRTVAIKLIHSHLSSDPEFVRRFEQEAAAVAQLRHPNIIQVYDFDHDGDLYYMVLEFVPGETLQARLESLNEAGRTLPFVETIRLTATICDAVAYAHQRGMIHRDLKPANVMLNPDDQPILMDFGVAKMLGSTTYTATGNVIGTAAYMSPEQARGERPDERADVYSLGVMLFEMVTGRRPFEGDSAITIMMKHIMEPVPDILQINSQTPLPLVPVIERALAKSPADRFHSVSEMATALRAVNLKPKPEAPSLTTAVTPPTPTLVGKAAVSTPTTGRRRLQLLVGIPVVLLALILGLFVVAPQLGGPALPPAAGMIRVKDGVYLVGLDAPDSDHAPPRQVKLAEFWIDQYEVTNEQYAQFVSATDAQPPAGWQGNSVPTGQDKHPVQGVTWAQADAYCQWANKRLPGEAEWEVAARGAENYLYPWGNIESDVELPRNATYAVGTIAGNRSRFDVYDMAGNVWEWVTDPYAPVGEDRRILRGGAYGFLKDMAFRLQGDPNVPTMFATAGFRCAAPAVLGQVAQATVPTALPTRLPEDVLYQDNFADPSSGWPNGVEGGYTFGYHPQSFYHIEVASANDRKTIFRGLNFVNFIAETDVLVDHTNTAGGDFRYGLAFRRSGNNYYAFTVSPRAVNWQVIKSSSSGIEVLTQGAIDSLRGLQKSPDRLRVTANGSTFTFSINDKDITQIEDSAYGEGDVGFIVETSDETLVHIHYDVLTIRKVEAAVAVGPTEAPTPEPAATPTPEPSATATLEPTPTPAPTAIPLPADMALIPAGYFLMGSSTGPANEQPEHPVLVDAFFLDVFEVTNAQYRECVNAGGCRQTGFRNSFTRNGYRDQEAYADYPVIGVTWDQAVAYCTWANKRLPTEAEWEFAASGPQNFTWPWGNTFDANRSAASAPDTQSVGSYPNGASPFGILDMAGNTTEWVADVYDPNFYAGSPLSNPINTTGGDTRVFRGGAFANADSSAYTTSRRYTRSRAFTDVDIGFRCAQDAPEVNASEPRDQREQRITEFCALYATYKPDAPCP